MSPFLIMLVQLYKSEIWRKTSLCQLWQTGIPTLFSYTKPPMSLTGYLLSFQHRARQFSCFLYFGTSKAFKISFKGHSQYLRYAWDNSSGTGVLNTTIARLSCKANLIFGMQVNKFIQKADNRVFL